jgi:hypothetical protein
VDDEWYKWGLSLWCRVTIRACTKRQTLWLLLLLLLLLLL